MDSLLEGIGDWFDSLSVLLDMWPLLLGLAALLLYGIRSSRRRARQEAEANLAQLHEMAKPLNGTVLTGDQAEGWSTGLWPPFERNNRGLRRFGRRSKPQFGMAVEFTRGPWRVRISQASQRSRTANRRFVTTFEHRIDIATADLPPLKVSQRQYTDYRGRPHDPDDEAFLFGSPLVKEPPATAEQRQDHWVQAAVSAPANQHLAAFTSDPAAAARMLNGNATAWLLDRQRSMPRLLTFESGLLYATAPGRIDPFGATETVNTMLGLLDCIPGAAPAGAVAGATPAQAGHATPVHSQVENENHLIAETPPPAAEDDEHKSSAMSTLGFIGIAIAGLALLLGLLGYGSVAMINGVGMATGLSEEIEVHIIGESDWRAHRHSSITSKFVGEYTVDGRTHQVGVSSGEVGDVIEGNLPPLPIEWLGFHYDEPTTDTNWWEPYLYILAGVVCFGLFAVPIWLGRADRKDMAAAAQDSAPGEPSTRPE
ncbi:hypothetical protein FHS23_000167 [Prauserella isguenensis]|uniref:Uncharacterized protein n=1 Tax=Prauserella isguenensis TaxID=1470180 RepID=A0A839RVQ6_9PSEU|nr:hypothetical protein [Prauserella isguenensis]MBB3049172.1 hypothetical protein [Prauserella isguenensis]